jgi:hypothetical protein
MIPFLIILNDVQDPVVIVRDAREGNDVGGGEAVRGDADLLPGLLAVLLDHEAGADVDALQIGGRTLAADLLGLVVRLLLEARVAVVAADQHDRLLALGRLARAQSARLERDSRGAHARVVHKVLDGQAHWNYVVRVGHWSLRTSKHILEKKTELQKQMLYL